MAMKSLNNNSLKTNVGNGNDADAHRQTAAGNGRQQHRQNPADTPANNKKALSHLVENVANRLNDRPREQKAQVNQRGDKHPRNEPRRTDRHDQKPLTAEQQMRRALNERYDSGNMTLVPGEMSRQEMERAKETLLNKIEIPINAQPETVQENQIKAASREARLELIKTGEQSVSKAFEAGGRDAIVTVSADFKQKISQLSDQSKANGASQSNHLTPKERRDLEVRVERQIDNAVRRMKVDLAASGEKQTQQDFKAADGKTYRLIISAGWQQKTEFKIITYGDKRNGVEWIRPESERRNGSMRERDVLESRTVPTAEFKDSVQTVVKDKLRAHRALEHQLGIENAVRETRVEMVSNNQSDFSDRQIIAGGKHAYEIDVNVDFDKRFIRTNPNQTSDLDKYLSANPQLTADEIKKVRTDFNQARKQTFEQKVSELKMQLAQTGDRAITQNFEYGGEKYKVRVTAGWDVDASHHTVDKEDVERFLRDSLVTSGGEEIQSVFKYDGRKFTGAGAVDFDLNIERLNSKQPSLLETLRANRAAYQPKAFEKAVVSLKFDKEYTLNATALDMQRDLARTGDEKMTRVVNVNGEKYRITTKADWDVEAKQIKENNLMTFVKIAASVAGAATGQVWIPAAVSFIDSAARGDEFGMLTSGLSFAGGVSTGVFSNIASTGSQMLGAGRTLLDPKANLFDKLLASASFGTGAMKLTDAKLTNYLQNPQLGSAPQSLKVFNTLSDINKWGGRLSSITKGDAAGFFEDFAGDYLSQAVRREIRRGNGSSTSAATNNDNKLSDQTLIDIGNVKQGAVAVKEAVNRVRDVYSQIYERMDARGQAAANSIVENARRRGIDPNLAKAQVNNLLNEGRDLDALIRADANRRGVPVSQIRKSLDGLVSEQRARIEELRNSNNASVKNPVNPSEKGVIVPIPTDKASMSGQIVTIPLADPENGEIQLIQNANVNAQAAIGSGEYSFPNGARANVEVSQDGSAVITRIYVSQPGQGVVNSSGGESLQNIAITFLTGGTVNNSILGNFNYANSGGAGTSAVIVNRNNTQMLQLYGSDGQLAGLYIRTHDGTTMPIPERLLDTLPGRDSQTNRLRVYPSDIFGDRSNVTYGLGSDLRGQRYYGVSFTDSGSRDGSVPPNSRRQMLFDLQGNLISTTTQLSDNRERVEFSNRSNVSLDFGEGSIEVPTRGVIDYLNNRSQAEVRTEDGQLVGRYVRDADGRYVRQNTDQGFNTSEFFSNLGTNVQNAVGGLTQLPQIGWDMTIGGIIDPAGAQSRLDATLLPGEVRMNELSRTIGLPRALADYFLVDPIRQPGETNEEYAARIAAFGIMEFGPRIVGEGFNRFNEEIPNSNIPRAPVEIVPEDTNGTPSRNNMRDAALPTELIEPLPAQGQNLDDPSINNDSPRNNLQTGAQNNQPGITITQSNLLDNLSVDNSRQATVISNSLFNSAPTTQERAAMAVRIMDREGFDPPLAAARQIPREGNAVVSGHGAILYNDMQYRLPSDVNITIVSVPGGVLGDSVGNSIDNGTIPSNLRTRTYRGGEQMPLVTILHPRGLNIGGQSNTMFPALPALTGNTPPVIVLGNPGESVPLSAIIERYRQQGITDFTISTCLENDSLPGSWHFQNNLQVSDQVRFTDSLIRDNAGLPLDRQRRDSWNNDLGVQDLQNQTLQNLLYGTDRGPQNFGDLQSGGNSLPSNANNNNTAPNNLLLDPNGQTIPGSNGQPLEGNVRALPNSQSAQPSINAPLPTDFDAQRGNSFNSNNVGSSVTSSTLTSLQNQNLTPTQSARVESNLNAVLQSGGTVNYGSLDSFGRSTGVNAYITSGMINQGTSANNQIYPSGFGQLYSPNNRPAGAQNSSTYNPLQAGLPPFSTVSRTGNDVAARGHLLGNQLGGSGDLPSNLVTLYQRDVNHPIMERLESEVRTVVESGIPAQNIPRQNVSYHVTPIYEGTSLIPRWLRIEARGDAGYQMNVTLENTQNGLVRVNP